MYDVRVSVRLAGRPSPSFPSDNFCYLQPIDFILGSLVGYHDPQVKCDFGSCRTFGSRVMPLHFIKLGQYHRFRRITFVMTCTTNWLYTW